MQSQTLDSLLPDTSNRSIKTFYSERMRTPDGEFWAAVPEGQVIRWRTLAGGHAAHKWGPSVLVGASLGVALYSTAFMFRLPWAPASEGTPVEAVSLLAPSLGLVSVLLGVLLFVGAFIWVYDFLSGPLSLLWNALFGCVDAGKIEGLLRSSSAKDILYFEKKFKQGPAREYMEVVRKKRPLAPIDFKCMKGIASRNNQAPAP